MIDHQRLRAIQDALYMGNMSEALSLLNANVPHRFTAAYELVDGVLHNRGLVDKKGEVLPEYLAAVPLVDSFCQFTFRDGFFETNDSANDSRLDGHPYKGVVVSYSAVPIMDSTASSIIGSLCHFDPEKRHLSREEFDLLNRVARLVTARMLIRGAVGQPQSNSIAT